MKGVVLRSALAAILGAAALLFGTIHDSGFAMGAKTGVKGSQGESWASIAKLPDWSGVWEPQAFAAPRLGAPPAPPPGPPPQPKLTPAYAAKLEASRKKNGANFISETANCVPYGLPSSMQLPYPIEFLFSPGRVTVLIETYSMVRRIYTDGRPMPEDPDLTYQGTSTGRWEGDTLIVETMGLLPETSVVRGIDGHGPDLKITERIRLAEPDLLEITTTLEDPEVFLEPFTSTARYLRHRDWQMMEFVCAQNNRDGVDEKGNPTFDLTRKPGE